MLSLNKPKFYDLIRPMFSGKVLTGGQVSGIERLLLQSTRIDLRHTGQLSYILATSFHETGQRMNPVRETFALTDAQAISRLDAAYKKGTLKVSSPYWRENAAGLAYFGRGDVQLTFEKNYKAMGDILGLPLVTNPDLALDPATSAIILFEGMLRGKSNRGDFSGVALETYVHDNVNDFLDARKVVNGTDKQYQIAEYANKFMDALILAGFDGDYTWSDESVRNLQRALKVLGLSVTVDGVFGTETTTAVKYFQRENGLLVDGVAGSATWDAIRASLERDEQEQEPEPATPTPVEPPKTLEERVTVLEERISVVELRVNDDGSK